MATERQPAACVWFTGRAGAGKTTIARALRDELRGPGVAVALVDEEALEHLTAGPDAIAWLTRLLTDGGVTVLVAADLPARDDRERVRSAVARFVEVFVDDGSGARAADGDYQEPFAPELRVPTHDRVPAASVALVSSWLEHSGALARGVVSSSE